LGSHAVESKGSNAGYREIMNEERVITVKYVKKEATQFCRCSRFEQKVFQLIIRHCFQGGYGSFLKVHWSVM